MLVESLCAHILRIDNQRERSDLLARLKASRDRAANQQFPDSLSLMRNTTGESPHAKTWHWIARQLLFVGLVECIYFDLRGAQAVVAKNVVRLLRVDQYANDSHALLALLDCKALKIFVQCWYSADKALAIMLIWIEGLLLNHA